MTKHSSEFVWVTQNHVFFLHDSSHVIKTAEEEQFSYAEVIETKDNERRQRTFSGFADRVLGF